MVEEKIGFLSYGWSDAVWLDSNSDGKKNGTMRSRAVIAAGSRMLWREVVTTIGGRGTGDCSCCRNSDDNQRDHNYCR